MPAIRQYMQTNNVRQWQPPPAYFQDAEPYDFGADRLSAVGKGAQEAVHGASRLYRISSLQQRQSDQETNDAQISSDISTLNVNAQNSLVEQAKGIQSDQDATNLAVSGADNAWGRAQEFMYKNSGGQPPFVGGPREIQRAQQVFNAQRMESINRLNLRAGAFSANAKGEMAKTALATQAANWNGVVSKDPTSYESSVNMLKQGITTIPGWKHLAPEDQEQLRRNAVSTLAQTAMRNLAAKNIPLAQELIASPTKANAAWPSRNPVQDMKDEDVQTLSMNLNELQRNAPEDKLKAMKTQRLLNEEGLQASIAGLYAQQNSAVRGENGPDGKRVPFVTQGDLIKLGISNKDDFDEAWENLTNTRNRTTGEIPPSQQAEAAIRNEIDRLSRSGGRIGISLPSIDKAQALGTITSSTAESLRKDLVKHRDAAYVRHRDVFTRAVDAGVKTIMDAVPFSASMLPGSKGPYFDAAAEYKNFMMQKFEEEWNKQDGDPLSLIGIGKNGPKNDLRGIVPYMIPSPKRTIEQRAREAVEAERKKK